MRKQLLGLAVLMAVATPASAQEHDHARTRAFNDALGVECSHCHVPDRLADGTKAPHATARRMIAMVGALNDRLGGVGRVECVTCHAGGVRPPRVPRPVLDERLARWPESLAAAPQTLKLNMVVYSVSLGVDCDFCHVADWKSAEKPAFKTVALMSSLFAIFPKHMPPGARTQCYMCHQGQVKPAGKKAGVSPAAPRVDPLASHAAPGPTPRSPRP